MKLLLLAASVLILIPACAASEPRTSNKYDLMRDCGYTFSTAQAFAKLPEGDKCTLNRKNEGNEHFYNSYVSSDSAILKKTGRFGYIEFQNNRPKITISSYSDDARGVEQELISTRLVSNDDKSYVAASLIKVIYPKAQNDGSLEDTEEIYECWSAINYGKRTAVLSFLCDTSSSSVRINPKSWQAELIHSISVD